MKNQTVLNLYPDLQLLLVDWPLNVYIGNSLILNYDYYVSSISIPHLIQDDETHQVQQRTLSAVNVTLIEHLNPSILEFWWSLEQDDPDEPHIEIESKSIVFTDLDAHQAYEILSVGNLYKTCCEPLNTETVQTFPKEPVLRSFEWMKSVLDREGIPVGYFVPLEAVCWYTLSDFYKLSKIPGIFPFSQIPGIIDPARK